VATTELTRVGVWLNLMTLVMDNKWIARDLLQHRLSGMAWSGFRALRRVESAPLSLGQLAAQMGIDAPAASVLVSDLVARGYVERVPDANDGRRKLVHITSEGRQLLHELRTTDDAVPAPVATLTPEELRELTRLVEKMREATRR